MNLTKTDQKMLIRKAALPFLAILVVVLCMALVGASELGPELYWGYTLNKRGEAISLALGCQHDGLITSVGSAAVPDRYYVFCDYQHDINYLHRILKRGIPEDRISSTNDIGVAELPAKQSLRYTLVPYSAILIEHKPVGDFQFIYWRVDDEIDVELRELENFPNHLSLARHMITGNLLSVIVWRDRPK